MQKSILRLPGREPDKAYVADMLWLPKARVAELALKTALQYWKVERGVAVQEKLWEETEHHLVCPREFLRPDQYPQFPFPFVNLSPRRFPKTRIYMKPGFAFRDAKQEQAYRALVANPNGVLNLAPGKGKTVLACKRIVDLGCPSLVVVHNSYLMQQWQERIGDFIEMPPGEELGIIQGKKFDWQHPVTLAMIHSLGDRAEDGKLPGEFSKHFGAVFYDEGHHLSAADFVRTARLCWGHRYGLTATPYRLDGTEFIYNFHIGGVFYSDLQQDLTPRVYFQQTPVHVDLTIPEVRDVAGEVNISKIRSHVGRLDESNNFRAKCIQEALDQGRKIIAISHSKDQLVELHMRFPESSLIVQETPQKERTKMVQQSQICFAIRELGIEGLDDDNLDTLFILTPFSSPNDLQQVMGRIQRWKPDKKVPVMVIFEDRLIRPFEALCKKLRAALKGMNIPYTTLAVP